MGEIRVADVAGQGKAADDFLALPRMLYGKKRRMQNVEEEAELLAGRHTLSKYFAFHPFVLYDGKTCAARFAITLYPGEETAYLGFFECVDDASCAEALFSFVKTYAFGGGYRRIVGPVDASFWIRYRMKVNRFDKPPYFSEPYHLPYYERLWMQNGYEVCDRYVSNVYHRVPLRGYHNEKYSDRLNEFARKGYKIVSPRPEDWDTVVRQVYALISELYSDFPVFKPLREEDFVENYRALRYIVDFRMLKMAYFEGEPVGFFIGVPDYGNRLFGKINALTMLRVVLMKMRSSRYVMLYMGVSPAHRGLGKAMTQTIIKQVYRMQSDAIGAFIHEGKPTETYVNDMIDKQYCYHLFEYVLI